jgi:hypothetical protein
MLAYGKSKRKGKIKAAFSSVAQTIEKSRAVFWVFLRETQAGTPVQPNAFSSR